MFDTCLLAAAAAAAAAVVRTLFCFSTRSFVHVSKHMICGALMFLCLLGDASLCILDRESTILSVNIRSVLHIVST